MASKTTTTTTSTTSQITLKDVVMWGGLLVVTGYVLKQWLRGQSLLPDIIPEGMKKTFREIGEAFSTDDYPWNYRQREKDRVKKLLEKSDTSEAGRQNALEWWNILKDNVFLMRQVTTEDGWVKTFKKWILYTWMDPATGSFDTPIVQAWSSRITPSNPQPGITYLDKQLDESMSVAFPGVLPAALRLFLLTKVQGVQIPMADYGSYYVRV